MGEPGGAAGADRAVQARHLQSGDCRLQEFGMKASGGRALPPVLMIHGAFCGPWSLQGLQEKFEAAGYSVAAPALRFHDDKRPPAALATTGLNDYADDLEHQIQELDEAPILVGHSMG